MIIGKNFFIAEMPKAGTTFLRNYFKQYKNIELTIHHETLNQNNRYDLLNFEDRIGLIRNPYEWYLSLWKWSCREKKGSVIFNDLVGIRIKLKRLIFNKRVFAYILHQFLKDRNKLKNLFHDVNSKKNFNEFLKIMLDFKNRYKIGSEYSFVPFEKLGYMTYIFFCQNMLRENYNIMYNSSYKLKDVIKNNNLNLYTNIFFKTESLNSSLKKFLKRKKIKIKNFKQVENNSTSKKLNRNIINFFSKENILLIEKNDSYIFEKFKYKKISSQL